MIRRGEPKLETGPRGGEEWRTCALPSCGSGFRPSITVSGKSTEHYCSVEHAAEALAARGRRFRHGMD